jgi:hypothetical protein
MMDCRPESLLLSDFLDPLFYGEYDPPLIHGLHGVVKSRDTASQRLLSMAVGKRSGFLVGEKFSFLRWTNTGPANTHLPKFVRCCSLLCFLFGLTMTARVKLGSTGWKSPAERPSPKVLVILDRPLVSPTDPEDFADMQTKELNNGRLTVAAIARIGQELVTGKTFLNKHKLPGSKWNISALFTFYPASTTFFCLGKYSKSDFILIFMLT